MLPPLPWLRKRLHEIAACKQVQGHVTEGLDAEIDRLVYELYGLTEEEIAIVEDSTRRVEGKEKS